MPDLHYQRDLPATLSEMWDLLATPEGLLQWWGPEGATVPEHQLDLSRPGPWFSVFRNSDGRQFKVSGHVTSVTPLQRIALTWAFHGVNDLRERESFVTFSLKALGESRVRLTIDHLDLENAESAAAHDAGWSSTLRKLAARLDPV